MVAHIGAPVLVNRNRHDEPALLQGVLQPWEE